MYHYIQNKKFLNRMKGLCSDIINQLALRINHDSVMEVKVYLVGSGAKNLATQNEKEPIDLEYNLCIINLYSMDIHNGREIKEYIREQFNYVLNKNGWGDCQDSKSALTTEKMQFKREMKTAFGIDLAITYEDKDGCRRLIHENSGMVRYGRYYWNMVPQSKDLQRKADALKSNNLWLDVRNTYLDKKNFYFSRNDYDHPSFHVYAETVSQIYDEYFDEYFD